MKYYLIAGESSGDLHGANLMSSIKKIDSNANFRFCGGELMLKESPNILIHSKKMSFMGFVEVLANLRQIQANFKQVKTDLLQYQPNALILIDYPGFNLKMAEFAKKNGIKVFYYISPKVWAWKSSRIKKIKAFVDHLLVIFPFETEFFKQHHYQVEYVGNPLLDQVEKFKSKAHLEIKSDRPILTILPGSRKMEVENILPLTLEAAGQYKNFEIIVAGVSTLPEKLYAPAKNKGIKVLYDQTYSLLQNTHIAIVTSGTATLETALFHVPQVVVYKANSLTIWLAKKLVKIKYISLVNLILDAPAIPELIQKDFNLKRVRKELNQIIEGEGRLKQLNYYRELSDKMGAPGASDKAAKFIVNHV